MGFHVAPPPTLPFSSDPRTGPLEAENCKIWQRCDAKSEPWGQEEEMAAFGETEKALSWWP